MTRSQTPPKQMAKKLARLLRTERPDYGYLKKVFQHTRSLLALAPAKVEKRLPELLTDPELVGFYEAVWHARNPAHLVMIKLLIFTRYGNDSPENGPLPTRERTLGQVRLRAVLTGLLVDAPLAEASITVVAPRPFEQGPPFFSVPARRAILP